MVFLFLLICFYYAYRNVAFAMQLVCAGGISVIAFLSVVQLFILGPGFSSVAFGVLKTVCI